MRWTRWGFAVAAVTSLVACGLDVSGVGGALVDASIEDATVDQKTSDASIDANDATVMSDAPVMNEAGEDAGIDVVAIDANDAAIDAGIDSQVDAGPDGCAFACNSGGSGWTPIYFAPTAQTACPGSGSPTAVMQYSIVANPCTCTCGSVTGSCTNGEIAFSGDPASTTCADPTDAGALAVSALDGGCEPFPVGIPEDAGQHVIVTPVPPPTVCGAPTVKNSVPNPENAATTCPLTCASGACAEPPPPASPFMSCVMSSGGNTCPSGFPHPYFLGTSVTDTRGCSACECVSQATCSGAKFTLYPTANCTGAAGLTTHATGSCQPVTGDGGTMLSAEYSATLATPACKAVDGGESVPTGEGFVNIGNEQTICCP
jgi:hypothetical protein